MIAFIGTSHAAQHLRTAAIKRGVLVTNNTKEADVIFISEDTPTDEDGNRLLAPIRAMLDSVWYLGKPIVLTSQVPPGFTRSLGRKDIYHQAETLRMKDAEHRAEHPDYIIVGTSMKGDYTQAFYNSYTPSPLPDAYARYLGAFLCPKIFTDWESAEFSKIAVNMFLAAQVDITNKLSSAAAKCGANWDEVALALSYDKRIGAEAYLKPGRWQDSKHLLRDFVTLEAISTR